MSPTTFICKGDQDPITSRYVDTHVQLTFGSRESMKHCLGDIQTIARTFLLVKCMKTSKECSYVDITESFASLNSFGSFSVWTSDAEDPARSATPPLLVPLQ